MRPASLLFTLVSAISYVSAADHQILVGGEDAIFNPNNVTAAEGDTVTFTFINGTHSVIQSTFVFPCQFINEVVPGTNGFNSGERPANNGTSITNLTVQVTSEMLNVTTWFYDGANHSCGWDETAVGGINLREDSNETLAGYERNAERLFGQESQNTTNSSSTTTARHSATATPTDTGSALSRHEQGFTAVLGGLVAIALCATFF